MISRNMLSAGGGGVLFGSNISGSGSESLRGEGVGVRPPRGGGGGGGGAWSLERLGKGSLGILSVLEVKKMEFSRELNR